MIRLYLSVYGIITLCMDCVSSYLFIFFEGVGPYCKEKNIIGGGGGGGVCEGGLYLKIYLIKHVTHGNSILIDLI